MKLIANPLRSAMLLILLGVVSILLALWLIPPPSPLSRTAASEQSWSLPRLDNAQSVEAAHQVLVNRRPWGKEEVAKKDGDSQQAASWRCVGIVHKGGDAFVVLLSTSGQTSRHRVGDTLPNGARLLAIHDDYIEIEREPNREIQQLYRRS